MKNTKSELKDNELEIICGGERFNEITIGDITGHYHPLKTKLLLRTKSVSFPDFQVFPDNRKEF